MGIVEEEADETLFWLEVTRRIWARSCREADRDQREVDELIAITVASIKTREGTAPLIPHSALRIPHSNEIFRTFSSTGRFFAGVISIVNYAGRLSLRFQRCPSRNNPDIAPTNHPGPQPAIPARTRKSYRKQLRRRSEQQVNGVENMLYMSSQSASDGKHDFEHHVQARHKSGYGAGIGPKTASAIAIPVPRLMCNASA